MRKYLSAAGALLLGILSVSCSEKGPSLEMEIDPMELSIAPEGGNQTFTVKSNKDWTLVADSWITPSTKGERGSEVTVTVNLVAGKNAEATARTGYVIISADGKKEKVVVTQEPFVAPAGIYNASDLADFANALKTDDPENIDLSKWTDADGTIKLYDDIDATALSCFPMENLPTGTVLDGQKHTVTLSISATPDAKVGMMDAKSAAKIMYADADAETINEKAKEYAELQSSPVSAARRGYVDTIIQPADTRKYVIGAFEMLFTKREESPMKKHGTV